MIEEVPAGDLLRELSSYAFRPQREGDSAFYRGSGDGLGPVLLTVAKDGSPASLKRLEHEYALRTERPNKPGA
jgi:hypothetical protein